jgi:hypothetical protein
LTHFEKTPLNLKEGQTVPVITRTAKSVLFSVQINFPLHRTAMALPAAACFLLSQQ